MYSKSFIIAFLTVPFLCGALNFSAGPWELGISEKNGAWQNLKYKGEELLANPKGEQTLNLNAAALRIAKDFQDHSAGEAAGATAMDAASIGEKESPVTLKGHHFDLATKTLTLEYGSGNWAITETIVFGVAGKPNRISRTAKFKSQIPSDLKFRNLRFSLFFPLKGEYFFPATFLTDNRWREDNRPEYPEMHWEHRHGNVTDLASSGNDRVKFSILAPRPELSIIVFIDSRLDGASVYYRRNRENLQADWRFSAQGWALPGQEQELAGAYLEVAEKNYDQAMRENCPQLLRDLGYRSPADRPEWVRDAAIYGLVMDPFHQMRITNIPEHSLPRMKQLGLNTAWYQPVNVATARYDVLDYMIIDPKLGTWQDYRNANAALHENKMRSLQDVVPHGGGQAGFLVRGQSAMMMAFTEAGDVLNSWAADFNNPAWKKYMEKVGEFYTGEQKTDGFRLDAIYGSKTLRNWRKAGFPSGVPGITDFNDMSRPTTRKMLPALWKQTMALEGGKVPPLEYDRASLASSYAGISMTEHIRAGSRRGNPDSAVLLESAELPFTACGDMHYDRDIQSLWFKLRALKPAEFVKGVTTWLDEQQYIDAPDTIRMRYMETGQVESWPYRRWFGTEGNKAIRALCTYIHGVPMVQEVFSEGEGLHWNRILTIRRNMESFRRGTADYRRVTSSNPAVFTVLRCSPKEKTAAAINFSPNTVITTLATPFNGTVFDLYSGKKYNAESGKIKITLPPFGNAVLAEMSELPAWAKRDSAEPRSSKDDSVLSAVERENEIEISSENYTLVIDRASGFIRSFGKKGGIIQVSEDIFVRNNPILDKAEIQLSKNQKNVTVQVKKAEMELRYIASSHGVEIFARSAHQRTFALAFHGTKQWELDSFEGMLADWLPENPESRKCSIIPFINKQRLAMDHTLVWASSDRPWDWNRPELRVFGGNDGVSMRLQAGLGDQYLYQALENKTGLNYLAKFGGTEGSLRLLLMPEAAHKESVFGKPVRIGKDLTLTNESYGWKIENKYYAMHILRSNGVIRELYAKIKGRRIPILSKQNLTADRRMFSGMPYAAASMDPESLVRLERKNGVLKMTFTGELRSAYAISSKDRMRLITEYVFNDSPEIDLEYTLRNSGMKPGKPEVVFSAERERFPKYLKWQSAASGNAGTVIDDSKGKKLKFRFFDGISEPLLPRQNYKIALTMRTDGKECSAPASPAIENTAPLRLDGGFEERCTLISEKDARRVLNLNFEYDETLPWYIHFATYVAPGIGRNGTAGLYMTWANPTLIQEIDPQMLRKGRYQFSFELKGEQIDNENAKAWCKKLNEIHPFLTEYTPFSAHLDYYTRDGKKKTISRSWKLGKTYNWKTMQSTFNLDEEGYAPTIRIEAMPEYIGVIYLDNLKFEKLR